MYTKGLALLKDALQKAPTDKLKAIAAKVGANVPTPSAVWAKVKDNPLLASLAAVEMFGLASGIMEYFESDPQASEVIAKERAAEIKSVGTGASRKFQFDNPAPETVQASADLEDELRFLDTVIRESGGRDRFARLKAALAMPDTVLQHYDQRVNNGWALRPRSAV